MKNKLLAFSIIALLLLSFLSILPSVSAEPSAVFVDDDAPASWYNESHVKTIQEGIDNVSSGGIVYIWDGIYYCENITVNKSVSLIGNGSSNTTVTEVFLLDADNINISKLHFNSTDKSYIIINKVAGVWKDVNNTHIFNCLFTNLSFYAIDIEENTYSSNINVSYNEFYNILYFPIHIELTENAYACHNTINNSGYGLSVKADNSTIAYNNITNVTSYGGMEIWECSNASVYNNTLEYGDYGIYLEVDNSSIYNNTVIGFNGTGRYGIEVYSSYDNLIYNNYFNNNQNAYDDGSNTWNTTKTLGTNIIGGSYLGGNYWSDYTGNDNDGDGLGNTDLPYDSSGGIIIGGDYLPLCTANNAPTQTGESPTNESTGIAVTPDLYVICNDADGGDTLTATWRSNSSGPWVDFATNTSISPGTNITQTNSNFSVASTTYWWSVNLSDGEVWCNETYHFTEKSIDADFVYNPKVIHPYIEVTFDDRSTGSIQRWTWDFGDGHTAIGKNQKHIYTELGNYTVILKIFSSSSSDNDKETKTLIVTAPEDVPPPDGAPSEDNTLLLFLIIISIGIFVIIVLWRRQKD